MGAAVCTLAAAYRKSHRRCSSSLALSRRNSSEPRSLTVRTTLLTNLANRFLFCDRFHVKTGGSPVLTGEVPDGARASPPSRASPQSRQANRLSYRPLVTSFPSPITQVLQPRPAAGCYLT